MIDGRDTGNTEDYLGLPAGFPNEFISRNLERRNPKTRQRRLEIGPRQAGDLGRLGLRYLLGLVPLDGCRQALRAAIPG
jgi:hypothetical protein